MIGALLSEIEVYSACRQSYNERMASRTDILATCDDIVREFSPGKVILFGSHAYGTPNEDSDVDLLVIMDVPEDAVRQKAVEIRQKIPRRFRMDLLVRTPEEIEFRMENNDWFIREIMEQGQILYESADIGVGAKG
jgi:predicted nucleotidyltransferase